MQCTGWKRTPSDASAQRYRRDLSKTTAIVVFAISAINPSLIAEKIGSGSSPQRVCYLNVYFRNIPRKIPGILLSYDSELYYLHTSLMCSRAHDVHALLLPIECAFDALCTPSAIPGHRARPRGNVCEALSGKSSPKSVQAMQKNQWGMHATPLSSCLCCGIPSPFLSQGCRNPRAQ